MRVTEFMVWDKVDQEMKHLRPPHDVIHFKSDGTAVYMNLQTGAGGSECVLIQYTGLRDVKRQKLYDGDVLISKGRGEITGAPQPGAKISKRGPVVVHYHDGAYKVSKGHRRSRRHNLNGLTITYNRLVKIGNIHEDPELLK